MSRPQLKLGGGLGGILRDLLLQGATDAKALISGAEGSDELRHVGIPLQAPKALGRFEDAGGDPVQHRLAAPRLPAPQCRPVERLPVPIDKLAERGLVAAPDLFEQPVSSVTHACRQP